MTSLNGPTTAPEDQLITPVICTNCKGLLPGDARFCAFCGHPQAALEERATVFAPDPPTEELPTAEPEPASVEPDAPKAPRRLRRWLVVLGLIVVTGVGAAAFLLTRSDTPAYDLEGALVASNAQVTEVWEQADRASTLDQLTAAGAEAEQVTESLEKRRGEFVDVGNDDDRRAAEDAVDAHLASLGALAVLATLEAEEVADWPAVADEVEASVAAMKKADAVLIERELPAAELASDVSAAAGRIEVSMASISEKLASWAAEVDKINADKLAQKQALDGYVGEFRGLMERYAGMRASLSDQVERMSNHDYMFSSAYADLGAALAQRKEVHAAMSALVPPSALVPAHTAIVGAVQDSTDAVQSAITGVEEYQWDYYYTLESTPGWQSFQRNSEQVSNAYNGGVGAWEAAVAAEEARIADITTPARPAV